MSKYSNSILLKNILINLSSFAIPIIAGIISIPIIINNIGIEKFGILTIIWMFIGYFSLFDFGLGRALTKHVAEKIGSQQFDDIPYIVFNATLLMCVAGIFGSLLIFFSSQYIVLELLNIPQTLIQESIYSFYILALSIPVVITITGLRGVFEAFQNFKFISINKMLLGIYTFISPLLIIPVTNNLSVIVIALLAGRLVSFYFYFHEIKVIVKIEKKHMHVSPKYFKPLLAMSGWLTITNIIGPFMIYIDRFFIGMILSMSAVTYYVTPYEIVTKLLIIPTAILGVIFPAFSAFNEYNHDKILSLFRQTSITIIIILFVACLFIIIFSQEGLNIWLSAEFSKESSFALQLLTIGIFINSIAYTPFSLLQGIGRSDITAKLHIIEFFLYIPILWFAISKLGINGAALTWLIRVFLDLLLLLYSTQRLLPDLKIITNKIFLILTISIIILQVPILFNLSITSKILYLALSIFIFILIAIKLLIDNKDIIFLKNYLSNKSRYAK